MARAILGERVSGVKRQPRASTEGKHDELEAEAEGRRADANAAAGDRGARGAGVPGGASAHSRRRVARARALASPFLTRDPASQPDPNTKITVPMQFAGKLDDSKFIIIWRVSRSR